MGYHQGCQWVGYDSPLPNKPRCYQGLWILVCTQTECTTGCSGDRHSQPLLSHQKVKRKTQSPLISPHIVLPRSISFPRARWLDLSISCVDHSDFRDSSRPSVLRTHRYCPFDFNHIHSSPCMSIKTPGHSKGYTQRPDVKTRAFLYLVMCTNVTSGQDYPGNRVTITFEKPIVRPVNSFSAAAPSDVPRPIAGPPPFPSNKAPHSGTVHRPAW